MATVIGSSFHITGELHSEEQVVLFGSLQGRVSVREQVLVEAEAVVEADIEGRTVEIVGTVTGNVVATDRVEIRNDGRLTGNIKAPRINIADGALFRGSVEMER